MTRRGRLLLLTLAALCALAAPAAALRVATWNLLAYDDVAAAARRSSTITALPAVDPDVIVVQELLTPTAADSFATYLRRAIPGKVWKGGASTFLLSTQSALYYDSLQVSYSNLAAVATGGPRQVLVALIRLNGYKASASTFRIYSVHFKAGNLATTADSALRTTECTNLRNTLNAAPANTNLLVGGDSNFYGTIEAAYSRLTESQADNDGRLKDPLNMPGIWNNSAYSAYLTQSPCSGGGCVGSNGGLDDRFDLFLGSYSLFDGLGLDVVAGNLNTGYGAVGNDGQHYNQAIDGGGYNLSVGTTVAAALRLASDHLPVVMNLQLPAKLATASQLDFGDAITGATVTRSLTVDNLPAVPAATLTYSFAAPAGFTAPSGSFNNAANAAAAVHTLGMATASVGTKSGTLTIASNDLDTTSKSVLLSGRVLAHAVPSLDSSVTTTSGALNFPVVSPGFSETRWLRVFNRGYSSLQARLATGAAYLAGSTRFSFLAPASPMSGAAATWQVGFNGVGAATGSQHDAELRIPVADESLPGATSLDTLRITLTATIDNLGVDDAVTTLRFAPPAPNPVRTGTRFAFDLPHEAPVSLWVLDAQGRRIATLAQGVWPAGRHALTFAPRDPEGAPLPAGLYFARFSTPGLERVARFVVLP